MNESNSTPPMIPTQPAGTPAAGTQPLGGLSEEREPITGVIAAFEAILRQPRRVMYPLFQPEQSALRPAQPLPEENT